MVCAFVNMMGLDTGGLIFGWAYIWNSLSVSKHGRLIFGGGGGPIFGGPGLIVGGLRICFLYRKVIALFSILRDID